MPKPLSTLPKQRVAVESRSGIWLLFFETLTTPYSRKYEQRLIRIYHSFITAKDGAILLFNKIPICTPLIVRDDEFKDKILRPA